MTEGLRLALRTSDPERLVDQLADLRRASLDSLGQPADALQEQAMTFLREQEQARRQRSARTEQLAPQPTGGAIGTLALAWLPAGDYEQAVTLWPDFAGSDRAAGPDGSLPHPQYCRTLQKILVQYADAGAPGLVIAPVRVAPFTAWCAEQGHQPDSAEARAEYAAHLAAKRDPALTAWPPGRNQPCWCGSGRKYKKCSAAPISADVEAHR